jgi:hypothetical protein
MATFKALTSNDITTTRTLLHEAIPMTGTLVSGTYGVANTSTAYPNEENIKNYSHGMFQSVFDYPHLSSSANHIFDITMGYATSSEFASDNSTQNTKKINMYNQMAQVLVGHDHTGSIKEFQIPGGNVIKEAYFINFSRLLTKDEIKKGSFSLQLATASAFTAPFTSGDDADAEHTNPRTLADSGGDDSYDASTSFYTDSPAGEYAVLTQSVNPIDPEEGQPCGLLYYQAGIAVISASMFWPLDDDNKRNGTAHDDDDYIVISGSGPGTDLADEDIGTDSQLSFRKMFPSASISASCHAIRRRLQNISFNNTTELNSTIHYCRIGHNDYNYSSNPTYLSASKIRVKNTHSDTPISYITTIGLYGPDNELLAVAKLSEPLKKTPESELTLRVRLDY